jgi:hypothetical protein
MSEANYMNGTNYVYHCNCTAPIGGVEALEEMIEQGAKISGEEAVDRIEKDTIRSVFGDGALGEGGVDLREDPCVNFFKSSYQGTPCIYVRHSKIEHVFLEVD